MRDGERIKQARIKKGLSQKQLGDLLGVSQQMIGQYESSNGSLKLSTLKKIARALEIPVEELWGSINIGLMFEEDLKKIDYYQMNYEEKIWSDWLNINGVEYFKIMHDNENCLSFTIGTDRYLLTLEQYKKLQQMSIEQLKTFIKTFGLPEN